MEQMNGVHLRLASATILAAALSACGSGGGAGGSGASGGASSSASSTGAPSTSATTGSASTSGGSGGSCAAEATFAEVLAKPLSNCAGLEPPCHNAGQANLTIDPSNAMATWKALVNVPTYTPGGGVRVVPGNPDASFLYKKLTNMQGPNGGSPMPKPGGQVQLGDAGPPMWMELPADEIEMVRCWIASGAADAWLSFASSG